MGYPDLKSDESIVLTAQHVKVKSVPFELVLTNRRLIIIDSEKNVVPTQQIPLITIRNVMIGENAIRDPVITLTILTDTADTRELALTFAMQTGGERRREAGEWVKALKKYIAEASSYPVDLMPASQPAVQPPRQDYAGSSGIKKKIEVSRPIKKIVVDTDHLPPKPVETSTLPEGTFCSRCGNRIPPGSTFCNRCGTMVVTAEAAEAPAPAAAAPEQITTVPVAAPVSGDRKSRPIEQIIHSIEPLIEDSVPRAGPMDAVPEPEGSLAPQIPHAATETAPAEQPAVPDTPSASETPAMESAASTAAPAASGETAAPAVTGEPAPSIPPVVPLPPIPEAPKKKRLGILPIAIIVIVIIAVAVGGFMILKNGQSPSTPAVTTTTMPTTMITTVHTTVPTTVATTAVTTTVPTTAAPLVPQTGIWAEVIYDKTYTGQVGTPGSKVTVTDTGDHFYIIPTKDGVVDITLTKTDGTGDELKVIVYSAGEVVKTASTTTPKGTIDLQFAVTLPTTATTPEAIATLETTTKTTAAAVNTTNSTA